MIFMFYIVSLQLHPIPPAIDFRPVLERPYVAVRKQNSALGVAFVRLGAKDSNLYQLIRSQ